MVKRSLRLRAKFLAAFAATLLIVSALASAPVAVRSPYLSALSDWAAGPAVQAAPGCANKTCDASLTRCIHQNGSHTNCGVGDFCRTAPCP